MICVQEEAWLYTAKMAGYGISIVLLLVYILTIQVLCHIHSAGNVKRNESSLFI